MSGMIPESNQRDGDRRKLLVILIGVLLLAFFTTSMASFFVSKKTIHESIVNRELPLTSDNIYSEIQNDLMKPLLISSTMANDTFLRGWVLNGERNPVEIRNYLSEIRQKYNTFSSFFVSDRTLTYYYADGILKQIRPDEPRDAWYFRVRDMQTPYEINVDPDMANHDAMTIFINYRVTDFSGRFIGATGIGLTVSMVKNRINAYHMRYGRNVFFVDSSGKIVLSPDSMAIDGRNIREMPGLKDVAQPILEQKGSAFEYRRDGKQVLVNARYLPELHWYLLAEQTEDAALAGLRQVLAFNLLICLAVTLAVALGVYRTINWYQSRLEKRCNELSEKNREIDRQKGQLEIQTAEQAENARRLAEIMREKDEFYSIVAHDLKNPMIGIVGLSKLLNEGVRDGSLTVEEIQTDLGHIVRSSTDMARLVRNLLDIHAIEAGQGVDRQAFDLCQLTREVVTAFDYQAQSKGIRVRTELPDTAIMVGGGRNFAETVANNLLSNAIKFSPRGTEVTVTVCRDGDRVKLAVQDEGPGLAAEEQGRLFQRFARLSARPTGGESSTGLGLFIVKKMAEKLGGSVVCESSPGKGARFTVEIPALAE